MQSVESIIHARWVIPVEPDNAVLEYHSIIIDDGLIKAILPTEQAKIQFESHFTHNRPDHAVFPGLINAHTHAAMSLLRGLADDMPLMQWLQEHIWPAEAKWVNPDFVADGTRLAVAEMLRGGITCFADMYYFPDMVAHVCGECHMRVCAGMIVIDFPTVWAQNADEYINKGIRFHDEVKNNPLVHTVFTPHAPYTVSDEPLRRIAILADELDVPIHIHVHETADEVRQSIEQCGKRPLRRLMDLNMLTPRLMAVHMTDLQESEIQTLATAGANVIHCPESNLKLASGFCPVHKLQTAGVNVALGTDGAASNNDLNMFGEMRTAALLGKGIAGDASALPAYTVLRMATLNAAKALGIDELTGSLKAGKAADIVAVNLNSIETKPFYDPISQLVYATGRDKVSDVWVAGKHVLNHRVLTTVDEGELIRSTAAWQLKIRENA